MKVQEEEKQSEGLGEHGCSKPSGKQDLKQGTAGKTGQGDTQEGSLSHLSLLAVSCLRVTVMHTFKLLCCQNAEM